MRNVNHHYDSKKSETISVIMPCYNGANHIETSIASVLAQSFQNIELIIVDDGSTDQSLKIVEEVNDPRVVIISQANKGVCVARNRGLLEATGDYVAFIDSDDTWRLDCLLIMYNSLHNQPDITLAYCGWQNIGLQGGQGKPFIPPDYETPDKIEVLLGGCRWPIHAALTRRVAIKDAGGFDERFLTSEDYGLWLRIASYHKIFRVPEVLAFYNHHDGIQATKNKEVVARNNWLVKREFLSQNPEIVRNLGRKRIRELTHGELLRQGYVCYWDRNLEAARAIFRMAMKTGYGKLNDWKYMLPCLLPYYLHVELLEIFDNYQQSETMKNA